MNSTIDTAITIVGCTYIAATIITIGIGGFVPDDYLPYIQMLLIIEFPITVLLMLGIILTIRPTQRKEHTQ